MTGMKKALALLLSAALFALLLGAGYPEKVPVVTEESFPLGEYKFLSVSPYTDEVAVGFTNGLVYFYDRDGNFQRGYQFLADTAVWRVLFNADGTFDHYYPRSRRLRTYDRDGNLLGVREHTARGREGDKLVAASHVDSRLVEYRYKKGAVWKEYPDGREELFRKVQVGYEGMAAILFVSVGAFLKLLEMYQNKKKQLSREGAPGGPLTTGWSLRRRFDRESVRRLLWGLFLVAVLAGCYTVRYMADRANREELPPPEKPVITLVAEEEYDDTFPQLVSVDAASGTLGVGFGNGKVHLYDSAGRFLRGYRLPRCGRYDSLLFLRDDQLGYYNSYSDVYWILDRDGTLLEEIPVQGIEREERLTDGMKDTDAQGNQYRVYLQSLIRTSPDGEETVLRSFSGDPAELEKEGKPAEFDDTVPRFFLAAAELVILYVFCWNFGIRKMKRAREQWKDQGWTGQPKGDPNGEP